MLQKIIQFSVRNKLIVGVCLLVLCGWGVYSITRLPVDAVPDITNNQVLVITTSPSLGAPDVERLITVPVEQATRNIPGIVEQRSFSRFGLSLVTIVFNDATDVYWARQQVSERLNQVRQDIPFGMGDPVLGPVTTGLGEVFQYVVRAKKGYEGKYTLTDLRSIQDWVVRRQLLGTEGVADVSSFGGMVKQYEVAVNPAKLKSFGLTIEEVFHALQNNNQNAGGAYIEKGPTVWFIRSEGLVNQLEDIDNIVIKQVNGGIPVLVKDVAVVQTGHAVRYGAMVYNGEGEVAGAVVMMLKGENSSKVIRRIQEKIAGIAQTLPEGVIIEPFLDRSKMVGNAISTVQHNLLEGALIVVFILVLFLGNLRAGFIVASVIPLSMLFAVILMNLFGVSGNLMSLGALDFGLLVDGAVIIVEAVMHQLKHHPAFAGVFRLTRPQMNQEVERSAGNLMRSAVFGQVIILVVYLPILSLQGIEGKMFGPMAQTVSFAILGAFLLSMTYVPMMTALLLGKKIQRRDNLSDRLMQRLQAWYRPLLQKTLKRPRLVVSATFVLFGATLLVLRSLGGEFIPQLEEGDYAVDTRLLTGTSLTHTVQTTRQAAGILLKRFPEIEKVVTKIGSGEIPTDPMPLEAADMMVILKPKAEWTSAHSFPDLANQMSHALSEVPGVATGFQFPVQMRFNELMTGARQDVVCKIFGDDLDSLALYAGRLAKLIRSIQGAKDLYVETVTGIPQLVVRYNRHAIAQYGASIAGINRTIQSAYAGAVAGQVFEQDKRYNLVIRMNEAQKAQPDELENLPIGLPNGGQVPLSLLATVALEEGPYQIQREDARRRITVGFNVRGRDVQGIVEELQRKAAAGLQLPPAYYIRYGGQYENLQHATRRLGIAVPTVLLLILLLLYFAFHHLGYSLLVFSAIPLSAIGGILALWARGMPFSISAGVGFIALFGVAVLNGIVLMGELNRLKREGQMTVMERITQATAARLRPVLMTATVASLGFLPMALSTGAGAEVQRPLATVVIGGLLTATLLTLLVLPALYLLAEKGFRGNNRLPVMLLLLGCSSLPLFSVHAQSSHAIGLQQALQTAVQQNRQLQVSRLNEKYYGALREGGSEIAKTMVHAELGNINSAFFDNRFTLTQSFALPVVYKRQQTVLDDQFQASQLQTGLQQRAVVKEVKLAYLQLQFLAAKGLLLQRTDSVMRAYRAIARLRFEKGETNLLEKGSLDNQVAQLQLQLQLLEADRHTARLQLAGLLNSKEPLDAADTLAPLVILFDTAAVKRHPALQYYQQQQQQAAHETALEKARLFPEWLLGYGNQSIIGFQTKQDGTAQYYNGSRRFSTVQLGIGIPVWGKAQKARVKAAREKEALAAATWQLNEQRLEVQLQEQLNNYLKLQEAIHYYQASGLPQAQVMLQTAHLSYRNGAIGYLEWGAVVSNAVALQSQYVDALRELNLYRIELESLLEP